MTLSYWVAYPPCFILVAPFEGNIAACVALYTPIRLVVEVTS